MVRLTYSPPGRRERMASHLRSPHAGVLSMTLSMNCFYWVPVDPLVELSRHRLPADHRPAE